MPREKPGFRDNMELLNRKFPEKELLNIKETASFMGVAINTAKRHIRFNAFGKISKADLARQISV